MYLGKWIALGWVLGKDSSSLLTTHFTYEDWVREGRYAANRLDEALKRFKELPPEERQARIDKWAEEVEDEEEEDEED
jgi:hypothetical protein